MSEERRCDNCTHSVTIEFGWSNWTVQGAVVVCMLKLHPELEYDAWYGEAEDALYANHCASYEDGPQYHLDVERCDWEYLPSHVQEFIAENQATS